MYLATLISLCSALLQLGVAVLMLGLSRAPGWARARLFVPVALSVAAYGALDAAASLPGTTDAIRLAASRGNYFAAGIHCAAWLPYSFGEPGRRHWGLSRSLRVVGALALLLGVLALIPGFALAEGRWHDLAVRPLHLAYRNPLTTWFGDLVGAYFVAVLLLPFRRYAILAGRGERGAYMHLAAFVFFFACSVNEVLDMKGVVDTPYLVDFGFLAIVLAVVSETVRRVVSDAQTLDVLTRSLEREVQTRTEERNHAREALLRAERLATLGRLARGVGHEINNPLTYVRTNIEFVRDHLGGAGASEELVHALDDAVDGALQIQTIISELQAYAQEKDGERRRVSLPRVAHGAIALVAAELHRVARVEEDFAPVPLVMADRLRLSQAFIALLSNAADAMRVRRAESRSIIVRTRTTADGEACAEIVDEGEGIPQEELARVFDARAPEQRVEGRAGLGLFVVRSIVESLGGRVEIESRVGEGTTARILLPSGELDEAPKAAGPGAPLEPSDDDLGDRARFLSLGVALLRDAG